MASRFSSGVLWVSTALYAVGFFVAFVATFNTALPVPKGQVIVREQLIWSRSTDDPTDMGRRLNVLTAPTQGRRNAVAVAVAVTVSEDAGFSPHR